MLGKKFITGFLIFLSIVGCNNNEDGPRPVYVGSGSGSGGTIVDPDLSNTDFNILFVGNSLTYTNDLPKLVQEKAEQKSIVVGVTMVALPNYAISDHWDAGTVQDFISTKQYDFVVIQQGPSSQALGRQILFDYGKLYNDLCTASGAKLVFYMVWPSITFYQSFDGVITNYREAAESVDALLAPVGEIWKAHIELTGDYSFYGNDGFHPSLVGSTKAADIILKTLMDSEEEQDPDGGG